jgi:hypothetical protein
MERMGSDTHASRKEDEEDHDWCPRLDRRVAIRLLGYSALATVTACGTTTSHSSTSTNSSSSETTTATATSLTASSPTVVQSVQVTLTATVSPSAATGTVTFYDGTSSHPEGMLEVQKLLHLLQCLVQSQAKGFAARPRAGEA